LAWVESVTRLGKIFFGKRSKKNKGKEGSVGRLVVGSGGISVVKACLEWMECGVKEGDEYYVTVAYRIIGYP
jgi:hypothetical protein